MPAELSQQEFAVEIAKRFGAYELLWIVEDDNANFRAGRGQVALVAIKADGWTFEPSAVVFKWATPKNVLRALVAFFQMMRYQKDVGVCVVKALERDFKTLNRMKAYGVLYFRGRIPAGSRDGDVFVFSINGKS